MSTKDLMQTKDGISECRLGRTFEVPQLGRAVCRRLLDCVLACVGLVLSSLLWLLISLAIKLEDGGAIFYAQERVGKEGRRFMSWKFRSMVTDSDEKFGPLQAIGNHHQVTRVGGILRTTAMDELP